MSEDTKMDRDVPIAINPQDKSRRDGAIHRVFGKKLHHTVPSWVPDGSRFHIRVRVAPEYQLQLTDPKIATRLLESAAFYHERQRWHTTLFLLMPDHLHAILSFPAQESMTRVIGQWKRYHTKEHGIRWQDNFFDHRLRNDAEANLKYDYIRRNPVVKNLCVTPDDWPWYVAL
jgi:putative transposase